MINIQHSLMPNIWRKNLFNKRKNSTYTTCLCHISKGRTCSRKEILAPHRKITSRMLILRSSLIYTKIMKFGHMLMLIKEKLKQHWYAFVLVGPYQNERTTKNIVIKMLWYQMKEQRKHRNQDV